MIAPLRGATSHIVRIGVALAIALNGLVATAGDRPKSFRSPLSTSLEPVKVKIGEYRLAIPEAYLDAPIEKDADAESFLTEDGFYNTSGVFMVTELPDLTPRTANSMQEWLKHRGWQESRWVNVLLQRTKIGMAGPSDIIFEIYSGIKDRGAEVRAAGTAYGLEWLAVDRKGRDNFVKFENGERTVFINCYQEDRVPSPACIQFIRIRPALHAKITYSRQYLPRWQEIEARVRSLIDHLIVSAGSEHNTIK